MIRIDNKKIITINDNECFILIKEFENLFVAADKRTKGNLYSFQFIKEDYPKIAELFTLFGEKRS